MLGRSAKGYSDRIPSSKEPITDPSRLLPAYSTGAHVSAVANEKKRQASYFWKYSGIGRASRFMGRVGTSIAENAFGAGMFATKELYKTGRTLNRLGGQAIDFGYKWGMGGKSLFNVEADTRLQKAVMGSSQAENFVATKAFDANKLRSLGASKSLINQINSGQTIQKSSLMRKNVTFNSSLRNKIFAAAAIYAGIQSIRNIYNYQDPRIPVYDQSSKYNLGATGDLGLSLHYSNR